MLLKDLQAVFNCTGERKVSSGKLPLYSVTVVAPALRIDVRHYKVETLNVFSSRPALAWYYKCATGLQTKISSKRLEAEQVEELMRLLQIKSRVHKAACKMVVYSVRNNIKWSVGKRRGMKSVTFFTNDPIQFYEDNKDLLKAFSNEDGSPTDRILVGGPRTEDDKAALLSGKRLVQSDTEYKYRLTFPGYKTLEQLESIKSLLKLYPDQTKVSPHGASSLHYAILRARESGRRRPFSATIKIKDEGIATLLALKTDGKMKVSEVAKRGDKENETD